ncbi:Carbohydrate sulfotransferase 15 [Saguinus oedipus]|uniref:Carbohydrate sulfotransferase 15 n=1 Tax=Saguinus oedipus TaxID=9490 RepID=A0ABQ9UPZ2_SAGOE|nr:Carbohydrate sulfotransferase 15 [Saguinus oedipus]
MVLYSDYLYFASSNKSADDFHEKVTEALQLFENCMLDYSLRACVYNNTLNNAMPRQDGFQCWASGAG